MLVSIQKGTVRPDRVVVIDNGLRAWRPDSEVELITYVFTPTKPMGIAESWNWFIDNVGEKRVICNDDLVFGKESLEKLTSSKADIAWAKDCGFSCFMLQDKCVDVVGRFDETISPGYGYYEDCDYLQRLDGYGTREPLVPAETVDAGIVHLCSQTLRVKNLTEVQDHHDRFTIAQRNYMKKWGIASL
jgi:hypothetical protein